MEYEEYSSLAGVNADSIQFIDDPVVGSHHHHHASLLKSSIKQEACFGAWAQSASFSLSLSLGVWALCASLSQHHNAVQSVRCRGFSGSTGR